MDSIERKSFGVLLGLFIAWVGCFLFFASNGCEGEARAQSASAVSRPILRNSVPFNRTYFENSSCVANGSSTDGGNVTCTGTTPSITDAGAGLPVVPSAGASLLGISGYQVQLIPPSNQTIQDAGTLLIFDCDSRNGVIGSNCSNTPSLTVPINAANLSAGQPFQAGDFQRAFVSSVQDTVDAIPNGVQLSFAADGGTGGPVKVRIYTYGVR